MAQNGQVTCSLTGVPNNQKKQKKSELDKVFGNCYKVNIAKVHAKF